MIALAPADATAISSSPASLKSRMVLPFWYRLTKIIRKKKPLSGCCCWKKWVIIC